MICAGYTKVWAVSPGEYVKLDGARGTTLRVTRGTLWITQEGDTRDIVLAPGDSFAIDRGGVTLLEAQGNSTVCVLGHQISEVHSHHAPRRLGERLRSWLGTVGAADADRRRAAH